MVIGRRKIDAAGHDRLLFLGLPDRKQTQPASILEKRTVLLRMEMLNNNQGQGKVHWDQWQQDFQGIQPPRRKTDYHSPMASGFYYLVF
jgi:hypothetical protein